MINATSELVSTGEVARRTNRSISGIKRLVDRGAIPPGVLITGSGRRVWRIEDLPAIERALNEDRRRKDLSLIHI